MGLDYKTVAPVGCEEIFPNNKLHLPMGEPTSGGVGLLLAEGGRWHLLGSRLLHWAGGWASLYDVAFRESFILFLTPQGLQNPA